MQNRVLVILLLALVHVSCVANYKKVMLTDPDALCLDGTRGAYYIRDGYWKTKFILNFEGGGWCGSSAGLLQTLEDCLGRSSTDLGSSTNYPDTWQQTQGILSDSNNEYADWTMVYLKYCDGTGHQGFRREWVEFKGKKLYFRGHNVTIAQLNSLDKINALFTNATDIIVTGQSAGGLAAYLWTNYIVDRASTKTKIKSLPDSGIFLDSTNFVTKKNDYKEIFLNFMRLSNEQIDPPNADCVKYNPTAKWKCMFAEYNYEYIKVPVFAIQSLYDTWCLRYIIGIFCESDGSLARCSNQELQYIEQYHANTSAVLKKIGANKKNGYWAPACANHCYSTWSAFYDGNYRIPAQSANSLKSCVSSWYQNLQVTYEYMDSGNWPMNKPCSGVKAQQLIMEK